MMPCTCTVQRTLGGRSIPGLLTELTNVEFSRSIPGKYTNSGVPLSESFHVEVTDLLDRVQRLFLAVGVSKYKH